MWIPTFRLVSLDAVAPEINTLGRTDVPKKLIWMQTWSLDFYLLVSTSQQYLYHSNQASDFRIFETAVSSMVLQHPRLESGFHVP
jgi:hypothetical protein